MMNKVILTVVILLVSFNFAYAEEKQDANEDGGSKQNVDIINRCQGYLDTDGCKEEVEKALNNIKEFKIRGDFLVPDSPAFDAMGVKPDVVTQPSNIEELGVSILSSTDARGNAQNGVAIDFAPYRLANGNESIYKYREDWLERFKSNLQVSFGTSKGTDTNDKSVRWSVGLRATLFDAGDPALDDKIYDVILRQYNDLSVERRNAFDAYEDAVEKRGWLVDDLKVATDELEILKESSPWDKEKIKQAEEKVAKATAELIDYKITFKMLEENYNSIMDKEIGEVKEAHGLGNWNASSLSIGVAPVFMSTDGNYNDSKYESLAVYASLAYGFDDFKANYDRDKGGWLSKNAQLLLHARYVDNELEALNDGGSFREQDKTLVGLQARLRGPSVFSKTADSLVFLGEASYIDKQIKDADNEEAYRYSLGIAIKPIADSNTTIRAVAGEESGKGDASDQSFVSVTLNFAS